MDYGEVLDMLNSTLRKQVEFLLNGQTIDRCPWFNVFSHEFISNILLLLYCETYSLMIKSLMKV